MSASAPRVDIDSTVLRRIRQHARSSMSAEVCGVLIGGEANNAISIVAAIQGENADQGGTHVTFTQQTWEHIYRIKDRDYPEQRIAGWYHSHPSFGVFLSEHDLFIHENFFSSAGQIAWVYDPVNEEEGCFGWCNGKVTRLPEIVIRDAEGGVEVEARPEPETSVAVAAPEADKEVVRRKSRGWKFWLVLSITHFFALWLGVLLFLLFGPVLVISR